MGIIRDSFVIFKNWAEAINELPEADQLGAYKALVSYGINGVIPSDISPYVKALLTSFSVSMENSILRYNASVENGKKGGRPKKEQPSCENGNLEKPRKTQENLTEPTPNLNDNVYVSLLVNYKYNISQMRARTRKAVEELCSEEEISSFNSLENILERRFKRVIDFHEKDIYSVCAEEVMWVMLEAYSQSLIDKQFKFNNKTYAPCEIYDIFFAFQERCLEKILPSLAQREAEIEDKFYYILGCIWNVIKVG